MLLPDIARLDREQAKVAHCLLPPWEVGEHVSRSEPSSIGFPFTSQREAVIEVEGKTRACDVIAGRLGILGGEQVHWLRVHEPSEVIEVTASRELRRAVAEELSVESADLAALDLAASKTQWAIAARLRSAARGGICLSDIEHDHLVRLLYASVYVDAFGGTRPHGNGGALDPARLARVTEYIETNIESERALDRLAEVAALSPFHFARSFRAAVGIPPHRYVVMRRLERAKAELIAGKPIGRVAEAAGYSSRSWFADAFHRHFGFRPADVQGTERWRWSTAT